MTQTKTRIFSIDKEEVARLNNLFYKSEAYKSVAISGVGLVVGATILSAGQASAAAAAASIAAGVTNAIDMIKAIDGIGLAAFGVALAPMGFMVTLRVLNMVLSRV